MIWIDRNLRLDIDGDVADVYWDIYKAHSGARRESERSIGTVRKSVCDTFWGATLADEREIGGRYLTIWDAADAIRRTLGLKP